MASNPHSERWWLLLAVATVIAILLLTRLSRRLARTSSPSAASATQDLIPVPSDPPTPTVIAELQARNKGLHWIASEPRTVMIVTPHGACGTLTGLSPAQISFHTGRDYDREPHLFSAWSDAYTAAEQYCETWAAAQTPPSQLTP